MNQETLCSLAFIQPISSLTLIYDFNARRSQRPRQPLVNYYQTFFFFKKENTKKKKQQPNCPMHFNLGAHTCVYVNWKISQNENEKRKKKKNRHNDRRCQLQ